MYSDPLLGKSLVAILDQLPLTSVAVVGDFCLDAYWIIDVAARELSLETGLPTRPVAEQRYSLGGAGNVVANLAALGCRHIACFGVIGADPWGYTLRQNLTAIGADISGLFTQESSWATLTYIKPHVKSVEESRLDFGCSNQLHNDIADSILKKLEDRISDFGCVIVNEQVLQGIHSEYFRAGLAALMMRHSESIFVADCRHHSPSYSTAALKVNAHEAVALVGKSVSPEMPVTREEAIHAAEKLFEKHGKPIFVTRGARGCIVRTESLCEIPGIHLLEKVDTVGAGDSVVAAIAACLAAKQSPAVAAAVGNFAAAVTVQKLNQTGTATPTEIQKIALNVDYIHNPELAEDPRHAAYWHEKRIELVVPAQKRGLPTYAIFDHDGTISTLREGWEEIMEPMMVKAILGSRFESATEAEYRGIVARVRVFIDQTTGVQTIRQMQGLQTLVREFGFVCEAQVLSAAQYKAIFLSDLIKTVNVRTAQLQRGELAVTDFVVKNAVQLLTQLHGMGITLYLASGTDEQDVIREAEALGYAKLFTGGIFGASGDMDHEAKRMVMERILREAGNAKMAVFGDGPVEIREGHRKGALTVGVASDELRRFGLNRHKRSRLIRAGAHVIVPDFSQLNDLMDLLKF